jgi:carboxyl-terminal processing protease
MNSKAPVYVIIALVVILGLCACVATSAFATYFIFQDEINAVLHDPSLLWREAGAQPPVQITEIPVGEEIDLSELFAPMWEARQFLREDFVEQPIDDAVLAQGAEEGLNEFFDALGVNLDTVDVSDESPRAESLSSRADTPTEIADEFATFWGAWRVAQYGQTGTIVSYQDLLYAALRGMVRSLGDENTGFLDPYELRQSDLSLEGNYEGIGAWVDTTTEYVTIIAPMEGSPAEAAGLLPGDVVIAVDGMDMTGVDGNVVISHILGPAGSTVVLTIQREVEPEPFDVEIVRAAITVPSVEGEILEGTNIAYVQLFTFGADSASEMHNALTEVMAENPSGLIIDLRNNGGGFLNTAVEITSEFIGDGVVLYEEYGDGTRDTYETQDGGLAIDIPLIVLVNGGTASASEILAGAIQDYERGQLVGETTFGKGSVQISRLLSNGQGALRITIAHWLTPDERQIHGIGLEPDVEVILTEEDLQAQLDPQLDRAIELLQANAFNN